MGTLGRVSGGDLRKAITTLQSAVRLKVKAPSHTHSQSCGCKNPHPAGWH